jgi:hypothetical protein
MTHSACVILFIRASNPNVPIYVADLIVSTLHQRVSQPSQANLESNPIPFNPIGSNPTLFRWRRNTPSLLDVDGTDNAAEGPLTAQFICLFDISTSESIVGR